MTEYSSEPSWKNNRYVVLVPGLLYPSYVTGWVLPHPRPALRTGSCLNEALLCQNLGEAAKIADRLGSHAYIMVFEDALIEYVMRV